ncbi:MAG: glycosyltransferase family 39 protein, partial [Chloroflexi bacterium]|nr:glycosyltransferase family 39 protein [Chloroflexota bacterium]
ATTEDEDQWIQRTGGFAVALVTGQWRGTYQIGHPGVTTMWVTDLALGQDRARAFATRGREEQHVSQVPDFLPALRTARVPFALLSALLATVCGLLAGRLFGPGPGVLAGLLLALDPYWSAMSPIVGMDGLLAGLMGASLLSALLAFRPTPAAWGWAAASGLLAGLALLTKGAALFLLPTVPLLALLELWRARGRPGGWRSTIAKLAVWSLALAAAALIWPAMWVDPLGTARRAADFIRETGGSAHGPGNFFLGQPVADPGLLFYPVALGLRLGPATLLGLLALVLFGPPRRCWTVVGPLLLYVLLFGLGLTVSPKKIDRYLLPLFPVLGVLAGLGWWLALRRVADRFGRPVLPLGLLLIGLVQLWPIVATWPHPLAAYNPIFGGIRMAERVLPVGWGEGLDTVGEYLHRQPNADQLVTGVWYPLRINFQAHAPGRVLNLSFSRPGQLSNQQLFAESDFYVDYIHARQRRLTPQALVGRPPDFVVSIAGVDYARVYRLK